MAMTRKYAQLRLTQDVDAIEGWASTATQAERNAVYEMLFALADSALLRTYALVDGEHAGAISMMVRPDLAVSLVFPEPGTFAVAAIGDPCVFLT